MKTPHTSDYQTTGINAREAGWFEIVTCGAKCPIRSPHDERLKWLEEDFIPYFLEWQNEVEVLYKGEEKRILARPTLEGLLFTTRNMIKLAKRLLQNGLEYVCLRILTQDVLEAVFGDLRSRMAHCRNPDISQVGYGISAVTQRKIIKRVKGGNTTFGAQNPWQSVCSDPLPKRQKVAK
ncbi:uncharacterized protein LOC144424261 [Styela clava]